MPAFVSDTFVDAPGTSVTSHTPPTGGPISVFLVGGSSLMLINPSGQVGVNGVNNSAVVYAGTPPGTDYDLAADITVNTRATAATVQIFSRVTASPLNFLSAQYANVSGLMTLSQFVNGVLQGNAIYNPGPGVPSPFTFGLRVIARVAQMTLNGAVVQQLGLVRPTFAGEVGFQINNGTGPPYDVTLSNFQATTPPTPLTLISPSTLNFAVYTAATATLQSRITLWYPSKNIVLVGPQADEAAAYLAAFLPARLST